ncbi:MAG: hypothetical protein F6K30_14830, partial [Cyanothece sp. SIO2G6]|nr:hypothetical protein [Cyanothece sp. SIO2G6]
MSGGSVAYRLRQNKSVDRYAFIELLSKLDKYQGISIESSIYISFGGYTLEDFKLIHNRFAITRMISLESQIKVLNRQKFNKPHDCIKCLHAKSQIFIDAFGKDELIEDSKTFLNKSFVEGRTVENYQEGFDFEGETDINLVVWLD